MASAATIYFPGNLEQVETVSELRVVPSAPLLAESAVLVLGGVAFADGSGGVYTWNSASLTADDGVGTIRPTDLTPSQAGRWKLVGSGAFATVAALNPLIANISANATAIAANDTKITTEKSRAIAAEGALSIAGNANATAIAQVQGTITSSRRAYATYAAAVTDAATPAIYPAVTAGTIAEVPITDTGTHTDPVVGGTVNNTGIFRWKATAPIGWERLYSVDAAAAKPFADAAAASATTATTQAGIATAAAASVPALGIALPGKDYAVQDDYGNASWDIAPTGVFEVVDVAADTLNGMPVAELQRRVSTRARLRSSVSHIIAYGQSLALGQAGGRQFLDADFAPFLRFSANGTAGAGPRAQDGSGTVAQNHASFVAYKEELNTTTGNGETVLGNGFRMLKALLLAENGIGEADYTYKLLGSAPGQSDTTIANLSKGAAPYARLIDDVTYGVAIAGDGTKNTLSYGTDYAVDRIWFAHGEADANTSGQGYTARATYTTRLLQLYTDMNTDIKALTGQAHDIKLLLYQMQWYGQTGQNVALAQLDAADANPNIIIVGPIYGIEHLNPTNVHLSGFGYDVLGAYFAIADKREVIDDTRFRCVRPKTATRAGRFVTLDFDVPVPPLVIDNALFATLTNGGLTAIKTSDGSNNAILSVRAAGPTRIVVELTSAVPGSIRAGFASWGNNIRDSQTLDAGANRRFPLYNGCVTFEKAFN
ncbi:MAG: hypothetical protein JWR85_3596 [Marmoricola sp.]|nr:hypothetical protein [Marmoricola sp.]